MLKHLLILIPFLAASGASTGGETAWTEVAPDVSIRLISAGQVAAGGTLLVGLEISMPETTKTYWRVPGDTGFPAQIDLDGSRGIVGHSILWPYPKRDQKGDYLDYAYFGDTVLPIELAVTDPDGRIELSAILGVCSEICVPAQADFSLPVSDGGPDRANGLRLRQALAKVPVAWSADPQPIGDVQYLPEQDALGVSIQGVDPMSLIAATTDGAPLFGAPQKSPQPDLVLLPILGKTEDTAVEGREVQLTFMTDMGAFEVNRTIQAATD